MSETLFALPPVRETADHWHLEDHYSGESRTYPASRRDLKNRWVRRHGGEGIVVVIDCDEPRCLTDGAP